MTDEKVISVFELYRDVLRKAGIEATQYGSYEVFAGELTSQEHLGHVAWMCDAAIHFVREGRTEKAMRWLGYVQGVLFMSGMYTLDDLKNHNRPEMGQPYEDPEQKWFDSFSESV